jgi:imidazolonepropionase-like amidohydrolase
MLLAAQVRRPTPATSSSPARLIDGMGGLRAAEIGVRGGWIAKIGAPGSLVDCRGAGGSTPGMVVAPGFIDVHSHTDEAIGDSGRRYNEGAARRGTTVGRTDGGAALRDAHPDRGWGDRARVPTSPCMSATTRSAPR